MPKYDKHTQAHIDYMVERLLTLEGGTITHVGVAVEDFNAGAEGEDIRPWWEVIPVLTVTMPPKGGVAKQYQVVILQDAEGNGPGWLDIDEVP